MSHARLIAAALGALAVAAAPTAGAATAAAAATAGAATMSHAKLWQSPNRNVVCGVEVHLRGKPAKELLCDAKGIPRPKRQGGIGDPFVQISARGRPQLVLISQRSFEAIRTAKLKQGTVWASLGVTCEIRSRTVSCHNRSGHGFTIGNGSYKSFFVNAPRCACQQPPPGNPTPPKRPSPVISRPGTGPGHYAKP